MQLGHADARAEPDGDSRAGRVRRFDPGAVCGTVISRGVRHREATVSGRTIPAHAGGPPAAGQFLALADEAGGRLERAAEEVADAGAGEPDGGRANAGVVSDGSAVPRIPAVVPRRVRLSLSRPPSPHLFCPAERSAGRRRGRG